MSNAAKTGGPAFPTLQRGYDREGNIETVQRTGMSLRDYFAATAIAGILERSQGIGAEDLATDAYFIADAMLKAREVRCGNDMDAELAELRKDKARMDWLEAHEADLDVGEGRWFVFLGERPTQTYKGSTPRAAIDAAMEGEQ